MSLIKLNKINHIFKNINQKRNSKKNQFQTIKDVDVSYEEQYKKRQEEINKIQMKAKKLQLIVYTRF